MILLLATASLRDKNTILMKEDTTWRESNCRAQLSHLFRELCVGLFQSVHFGLEVID